MKICLIGCGAHPRDVYLPSLTRIAREDDTITLAACCDLDAAKAEAFRADCGFERCYTDYAQMLTTEKPDALFIITPYFVTANVVEDVCRLCSCPIMIEKPPGSTVEEAERIRAALRRDNRVHQVAFNRHYMETVMTLKERLAREPLQHIQYAMTRINRTEPFFFVTAIHGIDAVRFAVGSPYVSCDFEYQDVPDLGENCYNSHMSVKFANGATGQLSFLVQGGMVTERFTATQKNRSIVLHTPIWHGADTPGDLWTYEGNKLVEHIAFEKDDMYVTNGFYDEMREFLRAAREGVQCEEASIEAAMQPVAIAECIRYRRKHYQA